jgi:hypothetical protein
MMRPRGVERAGGRTGCRAAADRAEGLEVEGGVAQGAAGGLPRAAGAGAGGIERVDHRAVLRLLAGHAAPPGCQAASAALRMPVISAISLAWSQVSEMRPSRMR